MKMESNLSTEEKIQSLALRTENIMLEKGLIKMIVFKRFVNSNNIANNGSLLGQSNQTSSQFRGNRSDQSLTPQFKTIQLLKENHLAPQNHHPQAFYRPFQTNLLDQENNIERIQVSRPFSQTNSLIGSHSFSLKQPNIDSIVNSQKRQEYQPNYQNNANVASNQNSLSQRNFQRREEDPIIQPNRLNAKAPSNFQVQSQINPEIENQNHFEKRNPNNDLGVYELDGFNPKKRRLEYISNEEIIYEVNRIELKIDDFIKNSQKSMESINKKIEDLYAKLTHIIVEKKPPPKKIVRKTKDTKSQPFNNNPVRKEEYKEELAFVPEDDEYEAHDFIFQDNPTPPPPPKKKVNGKKRTLNPVQVKHKEELEFVPEDDEYEAYDFIFQDNPPPPPPPKKKVNGKKITLNNKENGKEDDNYIDLGNDNDSKKSKEDNIDFEKMK